MHLDKLPVDFDLNVSSDRVLAGFVFVSARHRYACAESLIGAGFGGMTMGSLSRSLFDDGLRWIWIGDDPNRLRLIDGQLLDERSRICQTLDNEGCTCPNLRSWLEPITGLLPIAPVSGATPALPSDQDLIAGVSDVGLVPGSSRPDPLLEAAAALLDRPELRGAGKALSFAGHGSYLGLMSGLSETGLPGFDLRFDHEALYMQMAAAGVVAAAIGSSAIARHWWPLEVDRNAFLERALELASSVVDTATVVHGLTSHRSPQRNYRVLVARDIDPHESASSAPPPAMLVRGLPSGLISAFDAYMREALSLTLDPYATGQPTLHTMLAWTGAHSGLEAVASTYDQPGGSIMVPFAARALLEEAGRTHWRYSVSDADFELRATRFFDEYRAARKKAIGLFQGDGVSVRAAEGFFTPPSYVDRSGAPDAASPGRIPLPPIAEMLNELGARYAEPGWLTVAYSLLSQSTHATPLGLMHTLSVKPDGGLHAGELSPEMTALALDVACTASSVTLGVAALALSNVSDDAQDFRLRLASASIVVHDASRMVHGLD